MSDKTPLPRDFVVRRMTEEDVPSVVGVHLASFPGFFLSFLGPRFLREFYLSLVREPEAVNSVACDATGRVIGFVSGVTQQAAFFRRLVERSKWRFAFAAADSALRKPSIIPRLLRALSRSSEAGKSSADALLMSIGVSPEVQGAGLGRKLLDAFSQEIRRRGISRYCLTTDACLNDSVNAFYKRAGFVLERTYVTREGRRMNEYLMRLD